MRRYDLEDLSKPETYTVDEALATLVRRVVTDREFEKFRGKMSRGDFKRALLAGEYPELVKPYVDERAGQAAARTASVEAGRAALAQLELPAGYAFAADATVPNDHILLTGPFDEDLHKRLKRLGAQWIARQGWTVPLEKGKSLKRVFANWQTAAGERQVQAKLAEIHRWLGYVKEKAETGYLYQKGVDRLHSLGIAAYPDLARRLEAATKKAREIGREAEIKRWLGYVEAKARDGYLYAKGVSKLESLGISQYPDLAERLEAAKAKAAAKAQQPAQGTSRKARVLFPLSDSPPLNRPVRFRGNAVVFEGSGKSFRINEDHPSIHGSHLLGHEGERGAYFYYRPAQENEIEALEQDEAADVRRREAVAELDGIAKDIQARGERPAPWIDMEGGLIDHPARPWTIYGGGAGFLRRSDGIYYVVNNGADGDDWSRNNVRTGGAGAMGWRVPDDPALWSRIEELIEAARDDSSDVHSCHSA